MFQISVDWSISGSRKVHTNFLCDALIVQFVSPCYEAFKEGIQLLLVTKTVNGDNNVDSRRERKTSTDFVPRKTPTRTTSGSTGSWKQEVACVAENHKHTKFFKHLNDHRLASKLDLVFNKANMTFDKEIGSFTNNYFSASVESCTMKSE